MKKKLKVIFLTTGIFGMVFLSNSIAFGMNHNNNDYSYSLNNTLQQIIINNLEFDESEMDDIILTHFDNQDEEEKKEIKKLNDGYYDLIHPINNDHDIVQVMDHIENAILPLFFTNEYEDAIKEKIINLKKELIKSNKQEVNFVESIFNIKINRHINTIFKLFKNDGGVMIYIYVEKPVNVQ